MSQQQAAGELTAKIGQTAGGFVAEHNGLVYELEGVEREIKRGVRGTLAVYRKQRAKPNTIVHRTRLSLTAARARKKFQEECQERGAEIDERVLLALEEAARRDRQRVENAPNKKGGDGGDFSAKVPRQTLAELLTAFKKWLEIADDAIVVVPVAVTLAHLLGLDLVWLLIVAPPSGAKTEVLRALYGYPRVYALSSLTGRTLVSGLDTRGASTPSLLMRLDPNTMLVLKDLTSVLQMKHEEQQEVFGQLREIYDGRYDKSWGTGAEVHWEGRLGFIAGVTPIIDEHQQSRAVLGERFVLLRVQEPPRLETAIKALEAAGRDDAMRKALREAMHGFLLGRNVKGAPTVDQQTIRVLAKTADFITRARSGVIRDYRARFEYAPEPEGPARFAKSLCALAQGIACARDHTEVTRADLALAQRVALDCLPAIRNRVISALAQAAMTEDSDGQIETGKLAGAVRFSTATIRRALEDLHALEVVDVTKGGAGKADAWKLADAWVEVFASLRDEAAASGKEATLADPSDGTVAEKSPRVPPKNFASLNLTDEARQLLESVAQGGVPGFMTSNLRRIAADNGVDVAPNMTPNAVIDALLAVGNGSPTGDTGLDYVVEADGAGEADDNAFEVEL